MTTGPTADADVSRDQLMLQIELIKRTTELEKVRLRIKEIEHQAGSAPNAETPKVDQGATLWATTPSQEPNGTKDRNLISAEPTESVNQNENFEQWLQRDLRARQVLAAIGKSGKYDAGGKNIEGSWVCGFKEGMERLIGKAYAITKEDRYYIERLRRKCTSTKSWNYERVYQVAFKGADPVGLFQQPVESAPRSCQSIEESLHSKFPLAADIRLIGRRRNISASGSNDNNLYYIGKGSVFCSGTKKSCRCSEGYIEVMVEELFPHDGALQKFGGESHEELSTQVIQPHSRLMWHQSLVRHMPKENIRTKAKQRKKMSKGGKENGVRKSMREPKFSSKIVEIINQGVFARPPKGGAKRGRKRKGGAPVRTIEASKPVTSVVERPGKRRTTKLALE